MLHFMTEIGKRGLLFVLVFALGAIVVAAADAHLWQLPIGGYNAGIREWGVDQNGSVTAAGISSADGGYKGRTGYAIPTLSGLTGDYAIKYGAGTVQPDGGLPITFAAPAFTASPTCVCSGATAAGYCAPYSDGGTGLWGTGAAGDTLSFSCRGLW